MTSDQPDVDWADLAAALDVSDEVQADANAESAAWMVGHVHPMRILDVGCGTGGMTVALARAAPEATIVAADGTPEILDLARRRVERAGVAGQVPDLVEVDLATSPVPTGPFDLIWAGAVIHHLPDQIGALRALRAELGTQGVLALGEGGLAASFLPWDLGVGKPGLEGRVREAENRWFADMRASIPGAVPMGHGWNVALEEAGFRYAGSRTFLVERWPPLADRHLRWVIEGFAQRRLRCDDRLSADDTEILDRLLDDTGPDYLGNRSDVFVLMALTAHLGVIE